MGLVLQYRCSNFHILYRNQNNVNVALWKSSRLIQSRHPYFFVRNAHFSPSDANSSCSDILWCNHNFFNPTFERILQTKQALSGIELCDLFLYHFILADVPVKYDGSWGGGGLQPTQRGSRRKPANQQQQLQSGSRPPSGNQQNYARQPRNRPDGQNQGEALQRPPRGGAVASGDATGEGRLAEVGSLSRPGPKKSANSKIQSYNSYNYDRSYGSSNYRARRQSPVPWRNHYSIANYNKERYLQAK